MYWTTEDDPRVAGLRQRLGEFYNDAAVKYPFTRSLNKYAEWNIVKAAIERQLAERGQSQPVQLLEFGAGRTLLGAHLGPLRSSTTFTVQDITPLNEGHLREQADNVYIGPLETMPGSYNVIFSTYVWEHIAAPRRTLDLLLDRLAPGGSLLLFCPRYEMLGYVPPALRHHGRLGGLAISLRLVLSRLAARISGKAQFLVVPDPALFHGPWYRDADAVHLVSRQDLKLHLGHRGVTVRDCWPRQPSLKLAVLQRCLRLCVELRKP